MKRVSVSVVLFAALNACGGEGSGNGPPAEVMEKAHKIVAALEASASASKISTGASTSTTKSKGDIEVVQHKIETGVACPWYAQIYSGTVSPGKMWIWHDDGRCVEVTCGKDHGTWVDDSLIDNNLVLNGGWGDWNDYITFFRKAEDVAVWWWQHINFGGWLWDYPAVYGTGSMTGGLYGGELHWSSFICTRNYWN